MKKHFAALALVSGLILAACGGQSAHAAVTNATVVDNATGGNGRMYPIANAVSIIQSSPTKFTITFPDNTTADIADVGGAKFNAIPANYEDFTLSWVAVKVSTSSPSIDAYINIAQYDYAVCTGGDLGVGGNGHGSASYVDGLVAPSATCTSFSALKAHAN